MCADSVAGLVQPIENSWKRLQFCLRWLGLWLGFSGIQVSQPLAFIKSPDSAADPSIKAPPNNLKPPVPLEYSPLLCQRLKDIALTFARVDDLILDDVKLDIRFPRRDASRFWETSDPYLKWLLTEQRQEQVFRDVPQAVTFLKDLKYLPTWRDVYVTMLQ